MDGQLQSIQRLGHAAEPPDERQEIGHAIATELRELIDYHNVRVYGLEATTSFPVAMQGQVGEYPDETPEQLQVSWVPGSPAGSPSIVWRSACDDAATTRAPTRSPGTEDDLDESMLLAPMVFEDQVLGVLVLSKLGLRQFSDDELRLLVIYASFAAQAMANADATERLQAQSAAYERRCAASATAADHRIDARDVRRAGRPRKHHRPPRRAHRVRQHRDRGASIRDRAAHPADARGIHADYYLLPGAGRDGPRDVGRRAQRARYVADERNDPRVNMFRDANAQDGCLIVVPLRGRDGASGVLTLERLGAGASFLEDEFELVQLFAAQVSIALQNAEVYRAIEVKARTDDLTGLLQPRHLPGVARPPCSRGQPVQHVMVDLDNFRAVNDALGHQAGDGLLRAIASGLVAAGRSMDLVFRYGGDEFALILPNTDGSGAHRVAERVHEAVERIGRSGLALGCRGRGRDGVHRDCHVPGRRHGRCVGACSRRIGPRSWPSARVGTGSRRPRTACRWRRSSRSRSRRRSIRRRRTGQTDV